MSDPSCRPVPINALLRAALEETLLVLGQGPKTAVLFTLVEKYGLAIDSTFLTLDSLSNAILDLFGQDGGRLLLERLWLNLEELAQNDLGKQSNLWQTRNKERFTAISPEAAFNSHVSKIFIDFITDMLGPDVYTWIEGKMRIQSTTLNRCYFDADRISPVLWTSFSSAADFLLNNLIRKLSASLRVEPVEYAKDSSLRALLDDIRKRSNFGTSH